jgi:hypothetical protein
MLVAVKTRQTSAHRRFGGQHDDSVDEREVLAPLVGYAFFVPCRLRSRFPHHNAEHLIALNVLQ